MPYHHKPSVDEPLEFAESIINTVREPLIVLDHDLRVVSASRSFYKAFMVTPEETVGQLIYDLGNQQWDIPKLRELLETILPQKTTFDDYEVEHDFTDIGRRIMLLNARQIQRVWGKKRIILLAFEDITERRQLEILLEDSEKHYRRLFETANDGILLLEKSEGNIAQANPAITSILGYSNNEFSGKKLKDVGFPNNIGTVRELLEALEQNGIIHYNDTPIQKKTGQVFYSDIYMVDKTDLVQCNIRDITERKQAEAASRDFLDSIINTIADPVFVKDDERRLVLVNEAMCAIVGRPRESLIGKNADEMFPEEEAEVFRKIDAGVLDTGKENVNEELLTNLSSGEVRTVVTRKTRYIDPAGKKFLVGVIRDITRRKQREGSLRKSEERLRQITDNTKEWIWEVDGDGLYTYASQVVEEMLGYTPEEVVGGKYFYDFFSDDQREQIREEILGFFAEKSSFAKYINTNVHKDGGIVFLETSGMPILDSSGELLGYRGIHVDITERRKLEAQLRHAQKMEAVGSLAGGIAHDFNNILNIIMGYGVMVKDRLEPGSPAMEEMNEVLIAADRAADLTKKLLVFSRKRLVEARSVNINELIFDLKKLLVRMIRESIEFNLNLADTPLIVMADAGEIEQVLINLVTNARDAMLEGGRLTISTGFAAMDEESVAAYGYGKPGRYALITVADTGPGIDAEMQKKIFEPFFTTKGIGEGTGLGLAISYGIIKQHNGYIKVYGEPGQGTVFKIFLPLSEETASEAKKGDAAAFIKGGNETILIAEDDASLRKLTKTVLESFGYTVVLAKDGEDAITQFMENRERISLVLLDMIMPKKNGKEVSEAIIKVDPRMKVLFASGYALNTITNQDLRESGFDFIHKPFRPKELLAKVREVLER
jgi:PAS domain S-box-containing protein